MARKIKISFSVEYKLTGKLEKEYREWLDDHPNSAKARRWFAIDRFVGHHNLELFDKAAHLYYSDIQESTNE
jgi:hypothetical protein